jgi:hypothetical protein
MRTWPSYQPLGTLKGRGREINAFPCLTDFDRANDKIGSPPLFLRRNMPSAIDKPSKSRGVL